VQSAFLGYYGYPAVLCTRSTRSSSTASAQEHVLKDGDIIGIDFGIFKHGSVADSARTILCGAVFGAGPDPDRVTEDRWSVPLRNAILEAPGRHRARWQNHAKCTVFVVRTFVGHGLARACTRTRRSTTTATRNTGKRMKTGLVIAVEPMVNAGASDVGYSMMSGLR